MDNKHDLEPPISKETAFELLFNTEDKKCSTQNCFDKYGNYVFPTDLNTDTPNIVTGTPSGPYLNGLCILKME
jgi:hypothetical protein